MLLLKIFEYPDHYFLGYAEKNRVKRQSEEESDEKAVRELQEKLNRGITIDGQYFPTYQSVVEEHAQLCEEVAYVKYMCRKAGVEDWVSDEEDLDDITKEEINKKLQEKYQKGELDQE